MKGLLILMTAATSKAPAGKVQASKAPESGVAQRGVGLIEVLIALVVFALAVVGMAGLQLRTMSITLDSSQRTYVVSKSQDIADRIRSNGISAGRYTGTYNEPDNNGVGNFCNSPPTTICSDTQGNPAELCEPTEIALFDLYDAFCVGDGSLENQVIEWQTEISCFVDDGSGVPSISVGCEEVGATVEIHTTWIARSADLDADLDDESDPEDQQDQMTLRFVP